MPRSKRRMATLGDGVSISTGTSRSVTQGIQILSSISGEVWGKSEATYSTVINTTNHSSCALRRECASALHSPVLGS